jgi:plasmid replication initiation protein
LGSDLKIVKSNDLIENFIFNATEMELHMLNYAVAYLNPGWDNRRAICKFSIPDLIKTFGTNSNRAWEQYREASERLMKRTYRYFDENNKEVIENVVTRTVLDRNDKSWIEFKFNEFISDRLSNLKELFTEYDIKQIANFKSRYAFMLYEFFIMQLSKLTDQFKYKQIIEITAFKKNLNIEKKYSLNSDLKRKILEPSKKQINRHSDIKISYELIKTGRSFTHIAFTAERKKIKTKQTNNIKIIEHKPTSVENKKANNKNNKIPTSDRKEAAKKHIDLLKKNLGIKNKS